MTDAYSTPASWASGPGRVYDALSAALVARYDALLRGRRVLDIGAGTGSTSRALAGIGACPLGVDASWAMLHHDRARRPPAVVADAAALPVGDGAVGATVAAFVLSHVDDPVRLLGEARRVTAPGGTVLVASFASTGTRSEAHTVVDGLLRERGWAPSPWFRRLKEELEPAAADPARLAAVATVAGLDAATVALVTVPTGVSRPDDLVDWRLGSPGAATFVDAMTPEARQTLRCEARDALGPAPQPLVLDLRVLCSRSPATRRGVAP